MTEIDIIRGHIRDMLEARGDDVSYIVEHGDAVDYMRYYNEIITLDTDNTVVFFALNKAKELKDREKCAADMIAKYEQRKNFIIVLYQVPSSPILNQFQQRNKDLQSQGGMLSIFYAKELMYNPLKHTLVPKHEKMKIEESKAIMEMYMIRHHKHMPLISKDDVMARWLGLRTGDIVKITRNNETSGQYFYYRCCT
jgi:DNA-directed RNA polymerase subunit H (RpoH/RPB5)